MHTRSGAGEVGAVAFKAGLLEVVAALVTAAAAAGVGGAHLPLRVQAQAYAQVGGPGIDVAALGTGGHLLVAHLAAAEGVAVAGQPGQAAPVVDVMLIAPVVGIAVGLQAQPCQVAGAGLVQSVDGLAGVFQATAVVGVMSPQAHPMARRPLGSDIAVEVSTILVLRGQVGQVGSVFAETPGYTQVGLEQGGVEGPVEGFDVGVAPHAIVAAQPLPAQSQLLAGVGGQAAVAHPELAHGQVALVRLTTVCARVGGGAIVVLAQGIGFDGIGGSDRLAHGISAPVAALAVDPRAQVQAQAIDVTAWAGAQVAVVFGLASDFHFQAKIAFGRDLGQARAGPQQGKAKADPGFDERVEHHGASSPSTSFSSSCSTSRARVLMAPGVMAMRAWVSRASVC